MPLLQSPALSRVLGAQSGERGLLGVLRFKTKLKRKAAKRLAKVQYQKVDLVKSAPLSFAFCSAALSATVSRVFLSCARHTMPYAPLPNF